MEEKDVLADTIFLWVKMTPLGGPVEPEVYMIVATAEK
jgi:hypothetical protein